MKTTKLFLLVVLSLFLITCSSDEAQNLINTSELVGKWRIIMTPLNETKSTEIGDKEGLSEADFESQESSGTLSFFKLDDFNNIINNHDIDFEKNEVAGIVDEHFFLKVTIKSSSELQINVHQKNQANEENTTYVSVMNLIKIKNNVFEGEGEMLYDLVNNKEYPKGLETYTVRLVKINDNPDISKSKNSSKNLSDTLCDLASSLTSTGISYLTDDVLRPIGNCYGKSDGGGYYVFGKKGPGSIKPLWTQTFYVPKEWSWCKVRKYNFTLKAKKINNILHTVERLYKFYNGEPIAGKTVDPQTQEYFQNLLNVYTPARFREVLEDFYDKYGHFAISIGYNKRTGSATLYINFKDADINYSAGVQTHDLIKGMADNLKDQFPKYYLKIGKDIKDYFYLRRSAWVNSGSCNTPVMFVYLFGTIEVEYN